MTALPQWKAESGEAPVCGTGYELESFRRAERWKSYWAELVRPFVTGEVLEVGAGIGGSTALLAKDHDGGWLCLEPDPAMAQALGDATARGEIAPEAEVLCGRLDDLPAGRRFDSVVYIDVLEHIEDDAAELRRAETLLRPGGCLVVLAPAHDWLYSPFDAAVGHYRRYTAGTLDAVAPPALGRVAYGYVDSLGLPLSLANRILLRQAQPRAWQIRLWDRCLVPLSRIADKIHGGSLGKTLIAVYRKPAAEGESPEIEIPGPLDPEKAALLTKVRRFAVVGVLATLIHVAVFGLLVDILGWNAPTAATGIAFVTATIFSYFSNYRWTFGSPGRHRRFMPRFFTVTTSLFLLNLLIMHASVVWFGWHHWVGLGIVIAVIPGSSFLLNTFWAFASGKGRVSRGPATG